MPDPDPPNDDAVIVKTVRLTDRDVRDAARLFGLIANHGESGLQSSKEFATLPEQGELIKRARSVFEGRQLRTSYFNRSIFGEPAWDVLLVLYVADASDARQTIGKLAERIGVPPTTVLRWIAYLEKEGLVERQSHPTDRRVVFIRLIEKGRSALENYLRAMPGEVFV